jgi:hypothetical protein
MSTITATADNAKSQVRLDLDFSDVDAPYAYVTRVDATTGQQTVVRGHGSSTTISGLPYVPMQAGYKATLYDTEAPTDQAFYYTASAPSVTLNANSLFTAGYVDPWYPTATTVTVRISSTRAGVTFLAVQADGATATPTVQGEEVPATPGAAFSMTAVVSANVSNTVTLRLLFRDASGTILSNPFAAATTLTSTTITVNGTAPANTVSVQPFLQLGGTPTSATIVSFASVILKNTNAGAATSAGVVVQSLGACRLKDPLRPGLNVRVDFAFDPNPQCTPTEGIFFQSLDTQSQGANAATFNVNNQANPIVVSKTRSSPTSTLTLVSRTFPDRDRLVALLASGSPLLFQVPDEYGIADRFMSVGTTAISQLMPDTRFPIRVASLPHAVVSAPGGPMQGTVGARWSDMCNRYASWGAVNAAGLTWTQVLQGAAG